MIDREQIRRNLDVVRERISNAADKAGRDAKEIRLVVVTKGHPAEPIGTLNELGEHEIGESYVEEALAKQTELKDIQLSWHMIGHVQSRKAAAVVGNFDLLHSVDSLKLARKLNRVAATANRNLPILLECNTSGEDTKFGWPAWDRTKWRDLLPEMERILNLPNLRVQGLMSMAPFFDDPEKARPFFASTRELRDFMVSKLSDYDWSQLSMGMSGDFEAAILEGATILRIGTAILGPRPK